MVKVEVDGMICEKIEQEVIDEGISSMKTCEKDPRFQQQNVTKWCYHMFVDFHRCTHYFGSTHKFCTYFQNCYRAICPNGWVENWEKELEEGTFPRDTTKEMG